MALNWRQIYYKNPLAIAKKIYYTVIREGVSDLCEKIEYMRDLAMAQGKEEGEISGALKTLINLVKDGLISVSEGAKVSHQSPGVYSN